MGLNVIALVGNLTRDPRITYTANQTPVCEIGIAVNRRKDDDPLFETCVAFQKTAEFINKYFKKGDPIGIVGYLKLDRWQDKDEKWQHKHRVIINEATFVAPKRDDNQQREPAETPDDDFGF